MFLNVYELLGRPYQDNTGFEYHDPVTVTLLDTVTGETEIVTDVSTYQWTEGNWSCDCNRHSYFDNDHFPDKCECVRYAVTSFEPGKSSAGYTLEEFNEGYESRA